MLNKENMSSSYLRYKITSGPLYFSNQILSWWPMNRLARTGARGSPQLPHMFDRKSSRWKKSESRQWQTSVRKKAIIHVQVLSRLQQVDWQHLDTVSRHHYEDRGICRLAPRLPQVCLFYAANDERKQIVEKQCDMNLIEYVTAFFSMLVFAREDLRHFTTNYDWFPWRLTGKIFLDWLLTVNWVLGLLTVNPIDTLCLRWHEKQKYQAT